MGLNDYRLFQFLYFRMEVDSLSYGDPGGNEAVVFQFLYFRMEVDSSSNLPSAWRVF